MQEANRYTKEEIRSLLYYQGATKNIVLEPNKLYLKNFYSIPNAYEAINILLFDDIENEKIRLRDESRNIDPEFLNNMPEVLNICCNLYSAICKYTAANAKTETIYTYRDDRLYTYRCMKAQYKNNSFISSSLNNKKEKSPFQEKKELTFLEFITNKNVEYLDINRVLGTLSIYPEEEEILFPPFLHVDDMILKEMSETEKRLKGLNGTEPAGKYCIIWGESLIVPQKLNEKLEKELEIHRTKILDSYLIENAKNVWRKVAEGKAEQKEIDKYLKWKREIQAYVSKCYAVIKWNILRNDKTDIFHDNSREKRFWEDLIDKSDEANRKREAYEKKLQMYYKFEIVLGVIAAFILSLSILYTPSPQVKIGNLMIQATGQSKWNVSGISILNIIFLVILAVLGGVAGICKATSVKEKLIQRTDVFLKYDELRQRWEYEKRRDSETLDSYIEQMQEIMKQDNQYCREYTKKKIEGMKVWEESMNKLKDSEK